jgi:hypothetical protein
LAFVLELGSAVLREDDLVADVYVNRDANTLVVYATWADCYNFGLLWLLFCGVWNDQTRCSYLLGFDRLDDDAIF